MVWSSGGYVFFISSCAGVCVLGDGDKRRLNFRAAAFQRFAAGLRRHGDWRARHVIAFRERGGQQEPVPGGKPFASGDGLGGRDDRRAAHLGEADDAGFGLLTGPARAIGRKADNGALFQRGKHLSDGGGPAFVLFRFFRIGG